MRALNFQRIQQFDDVTSVRSERIIGNVARGETKYLADR